MQDNLTNEVFGKVFFVDGTLRDIYIAEVILDDWQVFLNWIRLSGWEDMFYIDGNEASLDKYNAVDLFKEKERHALLLSLSCKGISVNCHFFSEGEMEFDVDPKQIKSLSEARTVIEFMKKISSILGKESFLTMENTPEYPLVTVSPDGTIHIL